MEFQCSPIALEALKNLLTEEEGVIRHSVFKLQNDPLENIRRQLHNIMERQNSEKKRNEMSIKEQALVEKLVTKKPDP
jgi:ribosomal protein S6